MCLTSECDILSDYVYSGFRLANVAFYNYKYISPTVGWFRKRDFAFSYEQIFLRTKEGKNGLKNLSMCGLL